LWISKLTISDIKKLTFISDIINCYFGYPKLLGLFLISGIIIPDIRNYAKETFISDIQNSYSEYQQNRFKYQNMNIYFRYQKLLFWISEIVIFDIWNYF